VSFNYAARDYDTIKTDLLARADRVMPEWTDRDPSDFGMFMVDLWAMMGDVMHYYADTAATESMLATATQRESVLAIANLFDYKPEGRSAALGEVRVVNDSPLTDPVQYYMVERDTEFVAIYNDEPYVVHATANIGVPNGGGVVNIPVREGEVVEDEVLTDSALGGPAQKYSLRDDTADINSLRVDVYEDGVNAVPYTYVTNINSAIPGTRVFSAHVSGAGTIEVDFGVYATGLVPPVGATITATYSACSGAAGNLGTNAVTAFATAPSLAGVHVAVDSSSTALSGGQDAESIASMKQSIPSAIASQQRAVTYSDFVNTALTVPGVAKAALEFSQGGVGADDTATMYVHGSISDYLTSTDASYGPAAELRTLVETEIQERALLGVNVITAPTITYTYIDVAVTVYVNTRAVTNTVESDLRTALDSLFDFDNVHFGQLLHLGQLHRIILNVPGVDYCVVNEFALSTDGLDPVEDTIQIPTYSLPKKGTVGGATPTYGLNMVGGISTS